MAAADADGGGGEGDGGVGDADGGGGEGDGGTLTTEGYCVREHRRVVFLTRMLHGAPQGAATLKTTIASFSF